MVVTKYICNYAVARFMPYAETEEFVCIGVVLMCPQTGYFGYRLENKRRDRVTGFFPELAPEVFIRGRRLFEQHLQHAHRMLLASNTNPQTTLKFEQVDAAGIFKELVRPRESLFRFSTVATVLTMDPEEELGRLFHDYVHRHFAQREEYQEALMARKLQKEFKRAAVTGYRPGQLGDDVYKIRMPFVRGDFDKVEHVRAIKPLNLAQTDTTKIIDHGDLWNRRVERLLNLNARPDNLMFPVRIPEQDKRGEVARDVCETLQGKGVHVVPYGQRAAIVEFAQFETR